MPEVPRPPEPELESPPKDSVLAAISREMVKAMKTFYGRGPTQAKAYLVDDLLFVVMRGGTLQAEKTLLEAGHSDTVRSFRQVFENVMGERLVGTVEQLTERRVLTYQSQILFDPEIVIEIFVFDRPFERAAIEQTAKAILGGDGDYAIGAEDPSTDPE